jgi:MFS family permease
MILFRALQGALGASMIPIVFTSSLHYFQGPRRVYSAAVVGSIASVAPTLGPIIGGWITDTLNWHWLFYVNLIPGLAITLLTPLQRVADRNRDLLDGRGVADRRAHIRPSGPQVRHALAHDAGPRVLRPGNVELQLHYPWLRCGPTPHPADAAGFQPRFSQLRSPSTSVSAASPPVRLKYASGLFNMMRNLGGAVHRRRCRD